MHEYGELVNDTDRGNARVLREEAVSMLRWPGLAWVWNQTSRMTGQQITSWALTQPRWKYNINSKR